jgi:hypothetical protein
MKSLNSNVSIILMVIVSIASLSCVQGLRTEVIDIRASQFHKDSLVVDIANNSKVDTVVFSLYKQMKIKDKWITAVYDVFAEAKNPNTSLLIIDPLQKLSLRIHIDGTLYTNEEVSQNQDGKPSPYRLLFKGELKDNPGKPVVSHSNEFILDRRN